VSVFWLLVIAFEHLGKIYSIPPSLAAWAPLMIFVPTAVAMADSMRR
jgi:lipopolysaccharide export LptBFGC system permease protein LptF